MEPTSSSSSQSYGSPNPFPFIENTQQDKVECDPWKLTSKRQWSCEVSNIGTTQDDSVQISTVEDIGNLSPRFVPLTPDGIEKKKRVRPRLDDCDGSKKETDMRISRCLIPDLSNIPVIENNQDACLVNSKLVSDNPSIEDQKIVEVNINRKLSFNECITNIYLLNSKREKELEVNVSETELFTVDSFDNLIEENRNKGLPYFIVTINPHLKKKPTVVDATRFFLFYFDEKECGKKRDPLTREEITSFNIYKSCKKTDQFKFFCNESTLNVEKNGHAAKFIYASARDDELGIYFRSEEQYYLGEYYENKAFLYVDKYSQADKLDLLPLKAFNCFKKSQFWLKKSAESCNISAYISIAVQYLAGNVFLKTDAAEGLKYLKLAAHEVSVYDSQAITICSAYLEVLKDYPNDEETKYCLDLAKSAIRKMSSTNPETIFDIVTYLEILNDFPNEKETDYCIALARKTVLHVPMDHPVAELMIKSYKAIIKDFPNPTEKKDS